MADIARLKITLDEVAPQILRRLEVPLAIRLDDLHLVIQVVMGWENYHLFEFRVGRTVRYGIPDPDWPEMDTLDAAKARLADLVPQLPKSRTFKYLYDFGDSWEHTVKLEVVAPADPDQAYPGLLDARKACPPEDCGGPPGYKRYLEAIADPRHAEHRDMIAWRGPGFDPAAVDHEEIRKGLTGLARRWGRRKKP